MNERLQKLQKVTKKVTPRNPYFTVFYYNCNFVTYKRYTLIRKVTVLRDHLKGGICQKKGYKVTKFRNALKYGFRKQQFCNLPKSYNTAPSANIGKYCLGIFIQKVTLKRKVTDLVIFGGETYSIQ